MTRCAMRWLRTAGVMAVALGGVAVAQEKSTVLAAATATSVDAADVLGPAFEVATVRLANRDDGRHWFGTKLAPSGRLSISALSLESLVWVAYMPALETGKVEGGPKWADSVQWDIEAKVDEAQMAGWDKLTDTQRMERIKPMMRALLVERFELKVHEETRVTPVYALVQAKGGVKMKLVDAPPANADPQEQEARARDPKAQNKPPVGGFMVSDAGWVGNAVTIRGLLGQIAYEAGYGDRVMVDATGLDGHYDFAIKLSKDKDGPTPGQQIEDQLGLKVESRKVPIKIYVIDSAEKPSEN